MQNKYRFPACLLSLLLAFPLVAENYPRTQKWGSETVQQPARRTPARTKRRVRRRPASSSYGTYGYPSQTKTWALNIGAAYHSSSFGLGLGGSAYYMLDLPLQREFRVDAGLGFYFFPRLTYDDLSATIDYSSNAFEVFGTGRLHYSFTREWAIGGEAGLMYLHTQFSTTSGLLGASNLSESTFGITLGGFGSYAFTDNLLATLNLRGIIASGSAMMIFATGEYRF